jgi:hypothetical protein
MVFNISVKRVYSPQPCAIKYSSRSFSPQILRYWFFNLFKQFYLINQGKHWLY